MYREQGVSIHDKHVEVIVRQMLRRSRCPSPATRRSSRARRSTPASSPTRNRRLVEDGKQPAEGRPELMGITKASLATDSWLSAASFQETTRVLTEAAIEGKQRRLFGLKENVIIGKLIPAGTGMPSYREIATNAPDYEPLPFYSSDIDADLDLAEWLRDTTTPSTYSAGGEDEGYTLPETYTPVTAAAVAPVAVSNAGSASAGSGNAGFDTAAEAEFAGGAGGESAPSIDAAQVEALISALDPEDSSRRSPPRSGLRDGGCGRTGGCSGGPESPAARA